MPASTNGKAAPRLAQMIAALTALGTALAPRASDAQVWAEVTSDPDAASWSAGRTHLFARAQDNTLWHQWSEGGNWTGPESLGGVLFSAPGVASQAPGQLDVFVQGGSNTLWQRQWDAQGWSAWTPIAGEGQITSAPAAVSWGRGRVDVFARGNPDGLWHMWFDGRWFGPENLGGGLIGGPAAATWAANRVHVFVRGTNNALHQRWYDGQWHDWESLTNANTMTSDPAAVSWGPDRIDVFYRGVEHAIYTRWWDGVAWRGPVSLGAPPLTNNIGTLEGAASSGPAVSSPGPNRLELFARGTNSRVWRRSWDGTAWNAWNPVPVPPGLIPVPPSSAPNTTPVPLPGTAPASNAATTPPTPACAANQVVLDGTSCVTLAPWGPNWSPHDGARVAIRLRRSSEPGRPDVPWVRWMGISSEDNRTISAADESLSSRDLFTYTSFPQAVGLSGVPWYVLRAANGAYVSHWQFLGTQPGGIETLYAAATDIDEALVFTRSSAPPPAGGIGSPFLNTGVWWGMRRFEFERRMDARLSPRPGFDMCLSPYRVQHHPNTLTFFVQPNCYPSGFMDFFVVQ